MSKPDFPITTAVRMLREKQIEFVPHLYNYEERGGTRLSAELLHVPEHQVVKTLVFETETHSPLLVLMHGDREVSTKQLARIIGVKKIEARSEKIAQKHTGYLFGGTSPFGTRVRLAVYAEKTIFDIAKIFINGGKRGFLVEIDPKDLSKVLDVHEVEAGVEKNKN